MCGLFNRLLRKVVSKLAGAVVRIRASSRSIYFICLIIFSAKLNLLSLFVIPITFRFRFKSSLAINQLKPLILAAISLPGGRVNLALKYVMLLFIISNFIFIRTKLI